MENEINHASDGSAKESPEQSPDKSAEDDCNPATTAEMLEFAWHAHEYMNEYIRFADTKGGAVIAAAFALLAGMFSAGLHAGIMKQIRAQNCMDVWSWQERLGFFAFALLVLAVLAAAWSITPRLRNSQGASFIFWDSILEFKKPESFHDSLKKSSPDKLSKVLTGHLFALAVIAKNKYFWVAVSLWAVVVGSIFGGLALLIRS